MTPDAVVAAATTGLDSVVHMPKVDILAGVISITVAAFIPGPQALTVSATVAFNGQGVNPDYTS